MTAPNSPSWYDATTTDADTVRAHAVPVDAGPAPAAGKPARTVSAKIAAVIGVVAFLLGFGVSMLTGPLLGGGPGGAGGAGGPGGPPGTSQQSGTTTGTSSS